MTRLTLRERRRRHVVDPETTERRSAAGFLIEVGWIVDADVGTTERAAVESARTSALQRLRAAFPELTWRMPLLHRRRLTDAARIETVALLDAGAREREARRWDFAVVITDDQLVSYTADVAMGMPARALGVAALSLAHLEPIMDEDGGARLPELAARIERLFLHVFGHLNGLSHRDEPGDAMAPVLCAGDLDRIEGYAECEIDELRTALYAVADLRLEERDAHARRNPARFYLRVAWSNRREIAGTVVQLAPWRFPFRFGGLTIAAISTLVVLSITAESWDVGMSQSPRAIVALAMIALILSTTFVLKRQRLLVRHAAARLTEQRAIANLSVVASVALGMLTTQLVLFVVVFAFARLAFRPDLVDTWVTTLEQPPPISKYVGFGAFVASIALLIGALGASFESESYVRHVAYVDEET